MFVMCLIFNHIFILRNFSAENVDVNYDAKMRKLVRNENAMRKKIKFINDVCDAFDF